MRLSASRSRIWRAVAICFTVASIAVVTGVASAADAPHVSTGTNTDLCAMCHRTHSSASDARRLQLGSTEPTGNALLAVPSAGEEERELCYSCHGFEMLGSSTDTQASFEQPSAHKLGDAQPFGPSSVSCSTCHDSHGTARDETGQPYPGLLRRYTPQDTTPTVYSGDEYCATCHKSRPNNMWNGLSTWKQTAHSRLITVSPTGSNIVCQACHVPHGSPIAPLITQQLMPPSAPATYTVTSSDRQLCFGCHESSKGVYAGKAMYQTSSHASSTETVPVDAEWAEVGDSVRVGECDVCHNPMGSVDASGTLIPRMARKSESDLCLSCHDGTKDGLDISQFEFPVGETSRPEIATVWDPERIPEVFGTLSVFAAESTGAFPRPLFGPREWPVAARTGNAAYGDVDGDLIPELVVADTEYDRLLVFDRDSMNGQRMTAYQLPATPSFIAVDDFVSEIGLGLPEIAVVTRNPVAPYTSELRLFRYVSDAFSVVDGPFVVGEDVTGIASGDVTGTPLADVVVTSGGDDSLRIATAALLGPASISVSPPYPTRSSPRGPSVFGSGSGQGSIMIANSGEMTATVSVFDGAGTMLASYDATGSAGASAWDTLVADVVPQSPGDEAIVAMRHPSGVSSLAIFASESDGDFNHLDDVDTGTKYNTAALASGDVDGDGMNELVVANAGYWGYGEAGVLGVAPSVEAMSFGESGSGSVSAQTLRAGGVELAGGEPDVVVADLGPIGHSGHPTEGATNVHDSAETSGFGQHAECADCHNPHAGQVTTEYDPPYAPATNRGAWGVRHTDGGLAGGELETVEGVTYEYELCFKCHSSWTQPEGSWLDVASEFDTRNASFHGITFGGTNASVPAGSFVDASPAWTNDSIMLCTTCHTNSDPSKPRGPHDSKWAPMLAAPYSGVAATDETLLCYRCHKYDVYVAGTEPVDSSNFYSAELAEPQLHKLHVGDRGFTCIACHVNHGSAQEHLVREGLDWFEYPEGGACYTPCHPGGVANTYSRVVEEPAGTEHAPTNMSVLHGTIKSGDVTRLADQDGQVVNIATVVGPPSLELDLTFGTANTPPVALNVYGRYTGNRRLALWLWNYNTSQWVEVGRMPDTTSYSLFTYPLADSTPYVAGGHLKLKFVSNGKGTENYDLYLDRVWLGTE